MEIEAGKKRCAVTSGHEFSPFSMQNHLSERNLHLCRNSKFIRFRSLAVVWLLRWQCNSQDLMFLNSFPFILIIYTYVIADYSLNFEIFSFHFFFH